MMKSYKLKKISFDGALTKKSSLDLDIVSNIPYDEGVL